MRPAVVAMLARVFDDFCRFREIEHGSEEANEMALRLLALFNAGMVDEADLRSVIALTRPAPDMGRG